MAYVHYLVANAFIVKPEGEDLVINHKDEDKTNNNVENLEWVSRMYNVMYSAFIQLSPEEKAMFISHATKHYNPENCDH